MTDVATLLANYKDVVLRYEALSLAVRQRAGGMLTPTSSTALAPTSVQAVAAAPSPGLGPTFGTLQAAPAVPVTNSMLTPAPAASPGKEASLLGRDVAAAVSAAPQLPEHLPMRLPEGLGGTASHADAPAGPMHNYFGEDDRLLSLKPCEVEPSAVEVLSNPRSVQGLLLPGTDSATRSHSTACCCAGHCLVSPAKGGAFYMHINEIQSACLQVCT